MFVGHLNVVLCCNPLRIADPGAHDMNRVLRGQFCLAARPQVVENTRPPGESGSADDSQEPSPQVLVGGPVPSVYVYCPRLRCIEALFKMPA